MTDNEIIKALECCGNPYSICAECPIKDDHGCNEQLAKYALDIINRQQTEIERLQNTINDILDCQPILVERAEKYAKSDAIKEFAERLKEKIDVVYSIKHLKDNIDNAVKEMVGNIE